jgi:hypothetical protein
LAVVSKVGLPWVTLPIFMCFSYFHPFRDGRLKSWTWYTIHGIFMLCFVCVVTNFGNVVLGFENSLPHQDDEESSVNGLNYTPCLVKPLVIVTLFLVPFF